MNVGIQFQTPEEFFLGEKQSVPKPEFNPKSLPKEGNLFEESSNNNVKNGKAKESKNK